MQRFRNRPGSTLVQMGLFLGIWGVCQMIFASLLPIVLQRASGLSYIDFAAAPKQDYAHIWIWVNLLSQLSLFLIPVLLFAWIYSSRPLQYLGLRPLPAISIGYAALIGLVMVCCIPVLGALIEKLQLGNWADNLQASRKDVEAIYFSEKDLLSVLRNVALLAIVPAVCEEFFFRGIIMRFINSYSHNPWASILISAAIFSAFHLSVYNFLPIMLAGIILAYTFFKTGSLLAGIVVHALYNTVQVLLQGIATEVEQTLEQQLIAQVGMVVVAGTIIIIMLWKWRSHPYRLAADWSIAPIAPKEYLVEKQKGYEPNDFYRNKEGR